MKEYELKLFLQILNFLFKDGLTLWTALMSLAIIITAIIGLITYKNSLRKNEWNIVSELYYDFRRNLEKITFDKLSSQVFPEGSINILKKDKAIDPIGLILFLAKLGKFLNKKRITFESLEFYFYNLFYPKEKISILIENLKQLVESLPLDIKENFDYLVKQIGYKKNIQEFENIIGTSFSVIELDKKPKPLG